MLPQKNEANRKESEREFTNHHGNYTKMASHDDLW